MSGGGVVTISADRLLEIADQMKNLESELRQLGLNSFKTQPAKLAPSIKNNSEAMVVDLDISHIVFKQKKLGDGSYVIANDFAKWGWTLGFTRDGDYIAETEELTRAIQLYGSVQIGNRIFTLGGRDGTLINFKEI